ncbi:translocation/assembly module TamB domain-containing protein [bacterium]|nr:translocation/assembly module TamB domain-containing protein [bacterium]NUN44258.1 translocation/assembly module TamB domain-containing protein [bacterium]
MTLKLALRNTLKIIIGTVVSIVLLIGLVLAAIQLPWVKNILRGEIERIANKSLYAKLTIGKIEGNFLTHISVFDGRIAFGDTSVLAFESVDVAISPLAIFNKQIQVDHIRIRKPFIHAIGDTNGVINLARLAKPIEPEPVDSAAEPLAGFTINLDEFSIEEGHVKVQLPAFDGALQNLNVRMNVKASPNKQNIKLDQLAFLLTKNKLNKAKETVKTDSLDIKNIGLDVSAHLLARSLYYQINHPEKRDSLWLDINEFRFVTDQTDVYVKGRFLLPDSARGIALQYTADIKTQPLHLSDIRRFAPVQMRNIDKIEFEALATGNDRTATISDLRIHTPAGTLRGFADVHFGADEPLRYVTELEFLGINAAAFADNPDLFTNINGHIRAEGAGIEPKTLTSKLELQLVKSKAYGIGIDRFTINADVQNGKAQLTKFEGITTAGNFNCDGYYNLIDETYHLQTRLRSINIADVVGDTSLQSSINLSLAYDGKGLNPKTAKGQVRVVSDSSKILGRELQNLTFDASQQNGRLTLNEVKLRTPLANVTASGSVGLDSSVNLKYTMETVDFTLLKKYLGNDSLLKDSLNLKLKYNGSLRGTPNKMTTAGFLTLTNFIFSGITIDSMQFSYFFDNLSPNQLARALDFRREDTTIIGDVFLYTHMVNMEGMVFRDFTTSITKEKGRTLFEVSGSQDTADAFASVRGSLVLENEKRGELFFDELFLKINGKSMRTREVSQKLGEDAMIDTTFERWTESWKNSQPVDIFFDIEKNQYEFRNFNLDIGRGSVSLAGKADIAGDQNLDIKLKDLDLSRANALIGSKQSVVEGILNMTASLKGTFEKPVILADWSITKGKASEFTYENFLGNMQYLNRKIQVNMTLNQNSEKSLTMGGYVPIDLSFKDVKERFTNRPMNFKMHSEGIDLRFLQSFFGRSLRLNRGDIKVDMTISGNKEKPKLEGEVKIEGGQITFPRSTLGQTFRNISMYVKLTPERVFLDTLFVQSGKDPRSRLFAQGSVDLGDVLKDFKFENVDKISYLINAQFTDFVPINTKSETSYLHTASISGKMTVKAPTLYYTQISGDLVINNSEIWVVDPRKAKLATASAPAKKGEKHSIDFYKNLDLDVNIDLPENADNAIRSAEMLLTLYGNIGVTKPPESEEFFLSGDVKTRPGGKYAYLSIAFNIEKGDIVFTGEPGVNPNLDIVAKKRFEYKDSEGQSIPAEARIQVTGKLLKPEVAISAVERGTEDSPLPDLTEPADILSYLVLGVKTKDLAKVDASQAKDIVQQTAINQVLNIVANKAGLSKLEYIPSTSDASKATIEVGKRISETVSVNFSGGTDPTVGRSITLEVVADSVWGVRKFLKSWKKTLEFEYKQPPQEKTDQPDIFNLLLYFRKEY